MTAEDILELARLRDHRDPEFHARVHTAGQLAAKEWRDRTLQHPSDTQLALARMAAAVALVMVQEGVSVG